MVVRMVNGVRCDKIGNVELPLVMMTGEDRSLKLWTGVAVVTGGSGEWSIDYSSANFSQIRTIQITLESGVTSDADKPLGAYVSYKDLTGVRGKAYKVTSAGLLAAMQQVVVNDGTQVHVMVIGH